MSESRTFVVGSAALFQGLLLTVAYFGCVSDEGNTVVTSGDGGSSVTEGGLPAIGTPCGDPGATTCPGHAQIETLVCSSGGTWTAGPTCSADKRCDTRDATQGKCVSIDPACAKANPGDVVCSGATRVTCGPDLISHTALETCPNVCAAGKCGGVCKPGATQCTSGGVSTCGTNGTWGPPVACDNQVCTNGMCAGVCAKDATQCKGNAVETCDAAGQWGGAVACTGAGNVCAGGKCQQGRRVFITSTTFPANLGSAAAGDAKCQAIASAAGLGGNWAAWLSDGASSPSTRFSKSTTPYLDLSGGVIASSWSDLTSGPDSGLRVLASPIRSDESGHTAACASSACTAWTGTDHYGQLMSGRDCADWTAIDKTTYGDTGMTSISAGPYDWTRAGSATCDYAARLYCFEQ